MALKAVFFDVGETLVDEERWWRELAERSGLQPHVVWAALGVTIERGEEHDALWGHLGIARPDGWWHGLAYSLDDLYPDAIDRTTPRQPNPSAVSQSSVTSGPESASSVGE